MTTLEPGASEVFTHGLRVKPRSRALRATRPAPTITSGLEVLVQDVIAAMTTAPCLSWNVSPSYSTGVVTGVRIGSPRTGPPSSTISSTVPEPGRRRLAERLGEVVAHWSFIAERSIRSCGRFGPGEGGLDGRHVEFEVRAVDDLADVVAPHALHLVVLLDGLDQLLGAAGEAHVLEWSARRPGRTRSSRRTRVPCWRWWRGSPAACRRSPGP